MSRAELARAPTAAVDVHDLFVSLGGKPVLTGVGLRVERRQIVGLLGPNGAGKTTLLRCISGELCSRRGSVRLFGVPVGRLSDRRRASSMAVVPQTGSLPPGFTVRQIVAMGRTPHTGLFGSESGDDLQAVDEALRRLGLLGVAERRVEELSGGERQKVRLAAAVAQSVPLLLLDEPTTHLDVGRAIEVGELLLGLRGETGASVLLAMHDLNLAARVCDRLVLLDAGAVVGQGRPEEVLRADTLRACFATDLAVIAHPETGRPLVVPDWAEDGREGWSSASTTKAPAGGGR